MNSNELDDKFDNNEDITGYLDLSKARRPNVEVKRVNIDFPQWMVEELDKEAVRLGVTRQALVKFLFRLFAKNTNDIGDIKYLSKSFFQSYVD